MRTMVFSLLSLSLTLMLFSPATRGEVNRAEEVAPGVYFHEGDLARRGHCNNGWVVFEDYVLVIDSNFPSGAEFIIPKIRESTDKPIRFVFDTHHHGDHAYGNQVWIDAGATPVAAAKVIEEMRKFETGYYGGPPGRWENDAANRPDVARSRLRPPTLLFERSMIFDDGDRRVELLHFGTAHTRGDGFAWLPKEKILFTGDACVNGPYNFMGDGHSGEWLKTLEAAKQLGAEIICPGHGGMAGAELIDEQQAYFKALRGEVGKLIEQGRGLEDVKKASGTIKERIRGNDRIRKYIGRFYDAQLEKVFADLTE